MTTRAVLWAIVCATVAACSASYPTAPTPTLTEFFLTYSRATNPEPVGAAVIFEAYVVDSDRAFTRVTNEIRLSSSDTGVVVVQSVQSGPFVRAVGPGTADVVATFGAYTASLPITVIPVQRTYPYIQIQSGSTGGIPGFRAVLFDAPTRSRDVTAQAAWTSSNPPVATVDRGAVTAHAVGSTILTVSSDGVSGSTSISIRPRG